MCMWEPMSAGAHECGCPWPEVGGRERPVGCWLLSSSERAQSAFKYEPPLQHLHVKFASSLHLRFLSHILTKLSFYARLLKWFVLYFFYNLSSYYSMPIHAYNVFGSPLSYPSYPPFLYPLYPQSPRLLSPPPPDSIHERKWVILVYISLNRMLPNPSSFPQMTQVCSLWLS